MKLPEFMRKGGKVQPHKDAIVTTAEEALNWIASQGGAVAPDAPFDGIPHHIVTFRGFSHGGVTDEGLIHIADEDARAVERRRVKARK